MNKIKKYRRRDSQKELEYIVHITIKELGMSNDEIRNNIDTLKENVYDTFKCMFRLSNVKYNIENKIIKIINDNLKVKDPVYDDLDIKNILQQIEHLKAHPTHAQRSPEWYQFRNENVTASSVMKIRDNSKQDYYREIEKKCKTGGSFPKTPALLHGTKFEQVATDIYERRNKVKVLEFGCLPHKYIPHLAASPDGICNYSPHNPSYTGRMLEIKCPYSRQITGIIPEVYSYQMQVQMEVCDLDYCDFLECKIVPFDSFEEMNNYKADIVNHSFRPDEYGVVLEYAMPLSKYRREMGNTQYLYSPIGLSESELEEWINTNIEELNDEEPNFNLEKITYWILEYSSVVLVKRDRVFFEKLVPHVKQFWKDVVYFRDHINELDNYINSFSKPKEDYVDIDTFVSEEDDSIDETKSISINKDNQKVSYQHVKEENNRYNMIDTDDEEDIKVHVIKSVKIKKKKDKSKKTMKEHFKNGKEKKNYKYNPIGFCMLD